MKYFTQPVISNTYKMLCKIPRKLYRNFSGNGKFYRNKKNIFNKF